MEKEGVCMQATYRAGSYRQNTYGKKGNNTHMKKKDTMERSEKRSPYDSYDSEKRRNNRNRAPRASFGFVVIHLI